MDNLTRIVIGDWSNNDGHGVTNSTLIRSNKNGIEIREAYRKGTKMVGFDLTKNVCHDYKDSNISLKYH